MLASLRPTLAAPAALLALLAAPLAPLAPLGAQSPERHALAGDRIAIYNVAGSIRLEAGTGSTVEVLVTRRGADAGRLRIETGAVRGRASLRVVYPTDRIRWRGMGDRSSATFGMNDDGTFSDGSRGGRRVRVSSESGLDASADVVVRVPKGRDVAAYLGVGSAQAQGVDGRLMIDVAAADVSVTGTRGDLVLDTGSGEVTVRDVEGSLSFDTGSGDVTVENVRGDELVVDAGSGTLTARDVRMRSVRLDLGSGGARISGVTADDMLIDSGSGEVDVALTNSVRTLRVDSGSGDVTLRLPASYGATVEVDAGSGGIDAEVPLRITRRSRTALVGTIGDGSGRLTIDAGSGEIRLVRAN